MLIGWLTAALCISSGQEEALNAALLLRGGRGHVQAWPCGFLLGPPLVCRLLVPLTPSEERLWTAEALLKLCPAPLRLPENIYRAAGPGG